MALTPSNMLPLGTKAPDFSLIDTKDNSVKSLSTLKGQWLQMNIGNVHL